jgi:hypothetical protein
MTRTALQRKLSLAALNIEIIYTHISCKLKVDGGIQLSGSKLQIQLHMPSYEIDTGANVVQLSFLRPSVTVEYGITVETDVP